jgi:16S rRNA pseudouridine516 synthase
MTLEQILFSQGFGTRKMCRLLIADGDVTIGGEPCRDPAAQWSVEVGDVSDNAPFLFAVEGETWQYHAKAYLVLNKPAGFECSQKSKAHPSVYTLLPSPLRTRDVQSVGRLDHDTTGLLLFSDDGQFIHKMASPKHHVPKVYEVTTAEPVTDKQIDSLIQGVVLDDSPIPVLALGCERVTPTHLKLTLAQGKYHQVKRMLAAVGNHVNALHRSQVGKFVLPAELALGEWRFLTRAELALASGP